MASDRLYRFRRVSLIIAESVDTWRIIPRGMLLAYGLMIVHLFFWYKSIPTYPLYKCDPATLKIFIDAGMLVDQAKSVACAITDTIGGPTVSQTAFISACFGLAPIIFGLYTSTGPKWNTVDFNLMPPVPPVVVAPTQETI